MQATLAIQPAEQQGDCTRVMAEVVSGAGDDPKVGRPVGGCHHPGVQRRDDLVVGAMDHQQVPGRQAGLARRTTIIANDDFEMALAA